LATTIAAVLPTALAAFSSARSSKIDQPEKVKKPPFIFEIRLNLIPHLGKG